MGEQLGGNEEEQGQQGGVQDNAQGQQGQNGTQGEQDNKVTMTKDELNDRLARAGKSNTSKAVEEALNAYKEQQKHEKDEAKRLAGLSAEEKANETAKKLQEENELLKKQMARNEMTVEARKQISEKGIDVDDAILDILVTDEADTTVANIEAYAQAVTKAAESLFAKSRQGNSFGNSAGKSSVGSESEAVRLAERQKELNAHAAKGSGLFKRN